MTLVDLRLICVGCDKQADVRADGWRAFLASDEPARAFVYCPGCAPNELECVRRATAANGYDSPLPTALTA